MDNRRVKYTIYKEQFLGYTIAKNNETGKYIARNRALSFAADSFEELKEAIIGYFYS